MSIAIGHFVVGAALTTIVVTALVPNVRYPRTLVLAGGGWAMVADTYEAYLDVETGRRERQD